MGHKYDYPYIFVNEVQMPATFIARPANPRVDMGRRIIIEPAIPNTSIIIPAAKKSTHALLMTMLLFQGGTQARSGHTKTWGFCRE